MRVLNFKLKGQTLQKMGDFSTIMAGSKGYLKCRFRADDTDWSTAKKVAIFCDGLYVALDRNGECMVPDGATEGKSFKVQVAGETEGPGGTVRMLTNPVLVEQVK